jgi:hypothetical protein
MSRLKMSMRKVMWKGRQKKRGGVEGKLNLT